MSRFKIHHQSLIGSAFFPVIVIVGVVLACFHRLAFSGMIMARGDMYAYFYPYWTLRHDALMAGRIPLWTPDIFMGVPVLANSQVGLFYPLNWPLTPLDAPTAITISLLLHVIWTLVGMYTLARSGCGLSRAAALTAAVIFGLGGYVGAKVENINQLQALAWMPWLFLIYNRLLQRWAEGSLQRAEARFRPYQAVIRGVLLLGMVLALQLLAGHPQTVFITALGLGVYSIVSSTSYPLNALSPDTEQAGEAQPTPGNLTLRATPLRLEARARVVNIIVALGVLAVAGVIAGVLALPQLLPMLELSGMSNRSGGFNPQQAMAFSFSPALIGRGLLPSYEGLVFGEYLAYPGVIGLGLAVIGLFAPIPRRRVWIIMTIIGFVLALGVYNPLYWTLAGLPGFSFFRVPARWLALFAFGAALLAGYGLDSLMVKRSGGRSLVVALVIIGGLAGASFLAEQQAVDVIGPAAPTLITLVGWGVGLVVLVGGGWIAMRGRTGAQSIVLLLCAAVMIELFLASRVLAYNEVTPPDTYNAPRFTISQLQAYGADQVPPGRALSITQLLFDPGDIAALTARYQAAGMSDLAIRLALVATKQREVVAANLPLTWGIPSIDGFDGGLLPTGYYTAITSQMLPPGELRTIDGRLREIMARESCRGACIPDRRWLNLTNTRYLITDKVFDLWHEDVAYDTQFEILLRADESADVDAYPAFEATAIDVLYKVDCPETTCPVPARMVINSESFSAQATVIEIDVFRRARFVLPEAIELSDIRLEASAPVSIHAMTLVDARTGDFQQVTLGEWRRVLSSDIKLYENQAVLPRAFVVHEALTVADTWQGSEDTLSVMRVADFDPIQMVMLASDNSSFDSLSTDGVEAAQVEIIRYEPEVVEVEVSSEAAGWLVLTDAWYPGWEASVNGEPTPILRADVMFRAVPVPAGESKVAFAYRPAWWPGLLGVGLAAWLLGGAALLSLRFRFGQSRPPG